MSTSKLASFARRPKLLGATAALGIAGALALGFAPAANAATNTAVNTPSAQRTVTVTVTQKGNYTATYCVGDNLEGRCIGGVRKGQSQTFTTHPGNGEPVTVSIIASGGGSAFAQIVPNGSTLRLDAAGSKAKPTVNRK